MAVVCALERVALSLRLIPQNSERQHVTTRTGAHLMKNEVGEGRTMNSARTDTYYSYSE